MFQHSPKYFNDRWSQKLGRNITADPFVNHALDWSLTDFGDMTTPSDGIKATSDISLVDDQALNGGPFKIPHSSVCMQNSSRAITNSRRQKPCKFIPMIQFI